MTCIILRRVQERGTELRSQLTVSDLAAGSWQRNALHVGDHVWVTREHWVYSALCPGRLRHPHHRQLSMVYRGPRTALSAELRDGDFKHGTLPEVKPNRDHPRDQGRVPLEE